MKLKAFFALAAIAKALIPQAEAQNTNHTPGTVISWGSQVIPNVAPGTRLTKIAAGYYHSLALKSDGTVVAWGKVANSGDLVTATVPDGLNGVVAIAAGANHDLALKSDGTVVAWGSNFHGETAVPGGLNGVVAIAAGSSHGLALKSDGTVVAWGGNDLGQSTVPDGLNGVVAIAARAFHSLALIAAAPQPFTLGASQRLSDGSFRWMLLGEAGRNYTVQSSTNLTLWTDLQTVALGGNSVSITDTNASAYPQRFYRAQTR